MTGGYDLIVVGGGGVGLATAYRAVLQGARVLLLERFELFHERGASGGSARQLRIQYNEREISQLVLASIPLWRELQTHSTEPLLYTAGCLWFGNPRSSGAEGQIETVTGVMRDLSLPYEEVDRQMLMERFNFRELPDGYSGFLQPDGAAINMPATLRTLHKLGQSSGLLTCLEHQQVIRLESGRDGVSVHTSTETYHGAKLVIAPGPAINENLTSLGFRLDTVVWEMVGAFFRCSDPSLDYPTWVSFDDQHDDQPMLYYGFPRLPWAHPDMIQVAANFPVHVYQELPAEAARPDARVLGQISRFVREHMSGLEPAPQESWACRCALVAESSLDLSLRRELIADFAPECVRNRQNVVLCATGWVAKFIPLLGKICADLALQGKSEYDLNQLRLTPDLVRPLQPFA